MLLQKTERPMLLFLSQGMGASPRLKLLRRKLVTLLLARLQTISQLQLRPLRRRLRSRQAGDISDPRWLWDPSGWFAPFCAADGSARPALLHGLRPWGRCSDRQVSWPHHKVQYAWFTVVFIYGIL